MTVSSLDTSVALPDRPSSIAGEQRNTCLWNGHIHISFYPSLIEYSPGNGMGWIGEEQEGRGRGWQFIGMYGVTSVDHSLRSYTLLFFKTVLPDSFSPFTTEAQQNAFFSQVMSQIGFNSSLS